MRIGELSKETGVSERALRHYEEKGLLPSKRLANGYRDFDESAIEKVELIQMYLQLGLNLEEAARMLCCLKIEPHLYENPCSSILTLYEDKLNEVTKQISLLSSIQTNLQKHISLLKQKKKRDDCMFVIHGSSRQNGNTEALTNMMIDGIETEQIYLRDHTVYPITDQRHDVEGFQPVNDDYEQLTKRMLEHDTIVFATPLYWYGMSSHMKNFIDRWSQSFRDTSLHFKEKMKGKKMYVVIVGGDNLKLKALPLISQFQYIFDFVGSSFEGYIIGSANGLDEIKNDAEALAKAQIYNNEFKNHKQK